MNIATKFVGRWFVALLLPLALLVSGCQESGTGPVSGKITFQGKPVAVGDVTFLNPGTGKLAQGPLDSEGVYTLMQTDGGLMPGEYVVTVAPKVSYEKVQARGGPDLKMTETGGESIPMAYRNPASSSLKATIPGDQGSFDFELKK